MGPFIAFLAVVIGYFLGAISFARIVIRLAAPGQEITGTQFQVPGTREIVETEGIAGTAVASKLGDRYGCLTSILDILKVAIPTLVFKIAFPESAYFLIVAAAGVVGHNWPLYYRFKGGRGLSAIYGGFLVIDWVGTLVTAIAALFLGLVVFRHIQTDLSMLVAYTGGLWLMIPWLWFRTHDIAYVAYAIFVNLVFSVATIPDLKKMLDYKRQGVEFDFQSQMETTPMGRGLRKMGRQLSRLRGDQR